MYYPIQVPFLLNDAFTQAVVYNETVIPECSAFILCFWSMYPKTEQHRRVKNVIIADGCIDLIVNFDRKEIFFTGNQQTEFDYEIETPHISLVHAWCRALSINLQVCLRKER